MAIPSPDYEGPNEYRDATRYHRYDHIPGGVKRSETPPGLGELVLLLLVFALLAMGKLVFRLMVHVIS